MEKPSARSLRIHSRFAILRSLIIEGVVTRQRLSELTGLSGGTVSTIVNELIDAGVVSVERMNNDGIGRPHATLQMNRDGDRLLGVDVAETYVHVTAYDLALSSLGTAEQAIDEHEDSPEYVAQAVTGTVHEALRTVELPIERVAGIGVSLPGQVQPDSGVSVFAPNWDWHDVNLERMLQDRLDRPVNVDNPLKAIALAELWFGAGRETPSLVTVNLGTGVGAGLVMDGHIIRGVTNNAGEWGHTLLSLDGRPCRCGRRGCVEAYIGVAGLQATLAEIDAAHPALSIDHQADFVDAVRAGRMAGERAMIELISRTARYLAAALSDIINFTNPPRITLTGWTTTQLGEWLLPEARALLPGQALAGSLAAVRIEPTKISENNVSLGIATLTLELFLAGMGIPSRSH